jgi:hypothetical protein
MMNKSKCLLLALFLFGTYSCSPKGDGSFGGAVNGDSTKLFDINMLKADVEFFFSELEKTHPNLYYYHSRDSVLKVKDAIKQQLVSPMSGDSFEKLMALYTNHLFDGHTGLKWVYFDWETIPDSALLFPSYQINVERGVLYFVEGAVRHKILSINSKNTNELITTMRTLIGDDQTNYSKDCRIEDSFSPFYYHLYGSGSIFTLTMEQHEMITQRVLQGVAKNDLYDGETKPFELVISDEIALLSINDFDISYIREFPVLLDSCFNQIRAASVRYLFIDVSENEGGASDNVNSLLDYLYPNDYYFLDSYGIRRYSERYIENHRRYFSARYENKKEAEREYNAWKSSIESEYETEGYIWERENEVTTPYIGKLFVLQSYKTFSAAVEFSGAIKSSNRGILIGEPTSDPSIVLIDQTGNRMPNTNLYFGCASVFSVMPSGSHNGRIGVLPDIYCHHRDLKELKKNTNALFQYFKSIIAEYGDRLNAIEILELFE